MCTHGCESIRKSLHGTKSEEHDEKSGTGFWWESSLVGEKHHIKHGKREASVEDVTEEILGHTLSFVPAYHQTGAQTEHREIGDEKKAQPYFGKNCPTDEATNSDTDGNTG